jgi:hypothetical protein
MCISSFYSSIKGIPINFSFSDILIMSSCVPSILILGHSFVRRLRDDFDAHFDTRAASNFHLPESGYITLLGTGGRTVEKVVKYDLQSVHKYISPIL